MRDPLATGHSLLPPKPQPLPPDRRWLDRALILPGLGLLTLLALASLAWGSYHALSNSADLMRRAEEVALFVRGANPYDDPDMTYPPSAPAVFVPLVAPLLDWPALLRAAWLALNLSSLAALGAILLTYLRGSPERDPGSGNGDWLRVREVPVPVSRPRHAAGEGGQAPPEDGGGQSPPPTAKRAGQPLNRGGRGGRLRWAVLAAVAASKPVRLTIGMGQFSLIPLALVLLAFRGASRRPILSGLGLGVALIKPTMVLPFLVVFAVRGHAKALGVALAFQAAAFATVSAWLGVDPLTLLRQWVARAESQQVAGLIDLPSVVGRLAPAATLDVGATSLVVLALGAAALVAWRRASDLALLAFAGFLAAVFTYHRPYDLVLLLPTFLLLVRESQTTRERGPAARPWLPAALAFLFAALLIAPAHPSIIAESTYEAAFVPAAYAFLALAALYLAREPRADIASTTAGQTFVVHPAGFWTSNRASPCSATHPTRHGIDRVPR